MTILNWIAQHPTLPFITGMFMVVWAIMWWLGDKRKRK